MWHKVLGNLLWALGHHSELGWAIFGIDDLNEKSQVTKAYAVLGEMLPQLAKWQSEGKVAGVLIDDEEETQVISMGGNLLIVYGFLAVVSMAMREDPLWAILLRC